MKIRTYFSAMSAALVMAVGATSAMAQDAGRIDFVGSIVSQGCGTAKHSYQAYSAPKQLNFDLQLNDCLGEMQSVVSVSVDAMDKEGERFSVALRPQSSTVGVIVSPSVNGAQQEQQNFYLGGESKITPLDIRYHNAAGQPTTAAEKVYVILNLQYA